MNNIYAYHFRWNVLRDAIPNPDDEDGMVGSPVKLRGGKYVLSFSKTLDYIFLRDASYYFGIRGAETRGANTAEEYKTDPSVGMTVDIDGTVTVRIVNPYKTLFRIHDWLQSSLNILEPAVRNWIANRPYQEVVGKKEAVQREFDAFLISEEGKELLKYLEDSYGVRLKRVAFEDVLPPDEYTAATTKRAEAVQKALRIGTLADAKSKKTKTLAEGEAGAIKTIAEAEAARIKMVNEAIQAGGETALALRTLEAYETMGENGNTVIVGGNNPVQMLIDSSKGRKMGQQPSPTPAKKNQNPPATGGKS